MRLRCRFEAFRGRDIREKEGDKLSVRKDSAGQLISFLCLEPEEPQDFFYSGYTSLSSVIWYRTSSRYFFARYFAIGRFISR